MPDGGTPRTSTEPAGDHAGLARPVSMVVLSQAAMAASAACLVFASARTLDRPLDAWWYAAAFLGSWCVYLRDSAASCDKEDVISQPRRAAIFRGRGFWCVSLPIATAAAGLSCVVLARPHAASVVMLGLVGLLGLVHASPIGPGGVATKRFAAAKSIVVSIAWSLAAVGLPLIESDAPADRAVVVAAGWLVLLTTSVLLADSLLLDLRDRAADRAFGLRTIAVRTGSRGVHALVAVLLAVAALSAVLGASDAVDPTRWRRVSTAAVLGLAVPWFAWRSIRRDEVATTATIMAWRFLAALAVL